jgi:hypothetical protein
MISFATGLVATLLGLLIVFRMLENRESFLRARGYAFKFHEMRDRLQMATIEGKIGKTSVAYEFLQGSLNLAIRNAKEMRLSQVIELSRAVEKNADDDGFTKILEDIQRYGPEVRKLYDEFFQALIFMLISNDRITSLMFNGARFMAEALNHATMRKVKSFGEWLFPEHAEAVFEARRYQRWKRRMSALSC